MTSLDSILKCRENILLTKVHIVKPVVFPVVMYECENWTMKRAECWRIDAFELCWRRPLRVPWTARRSNQIILKEIKPEYSLEGLMRGWHSNTLVTWFEDLDAGKDWGQEEKGETEDETAGWHHRLSGHKFEQTPGDSEGQESLVCCCPWGRKKLDTT